VIRKHKKTNILLVEKNKEIVTVNQKLNVLNETLEELINQRTGDLREALNQIDSANQDKIFFMEGISHEIRTPLNAILGLTQIIESENINNSNSENIETLKNATQNLLSLLNESLDFSKLAKNLFIYENQHFSLKELQVSLDEEFQFYIKSKNLKINFHFENLLIYAPYLPIKQVIVSLYRYAAGMLPLHSKIDLSAKQTAENKLCICMQINLPDNHTSNIYTINFSAFETQFAKRMLLNLNSTLIEKSTDNSLFYSFDIRTESPIKPDNEIMNNNSVSINKQTILVVEDNHINSFVIEKILSKHGYGVVCIDSGYSLEKVLKSTAFDLIIMDLQLPDISGFELINQIRKMEKPIDSIPIIAISASQSVNISEKLEKSGIRLFISKPIEEKKLIEDINNLLND
jgi:CheY-like chemotaxis protein